MFSVNISPLVVVVAQSCPTLCDPTDPASLLCPWDFPGKNTGVHWDDPEGWYGEGGGRRLQDGEHMYTCGGFISIFGKTNTIFESLKIKLKKKRIDSFPSYRFDSLK